MNKKILFALIISTFVSLTVVGQDSESKEPRKRSRVVVTDNIEISATLPTRKVKIISSAPATNTLPQPAATPPPTVAPSNTLADNPTIPGPTSLRYGQIRNKISEAKRQMQVKPLRISITDTEQTHEIVRLAFYDQTQDIVDYAVIRKVDFLDRKSEVLARSDSGQTVRVKTIRGNGVNTPIIIYDSYNRPMLPLLVQYPIEKYGKFREMSYYISTHPGLVTPEIVNAGKLYLRNVLDAAREKLREEGIFIQPKVVDIAERLALVEHVDHARFRNEYHPTIYNDVYTLYALNQGQTYRYSVSSAGAGGMVQMIPSTYRMVRSRYYSVGLMPDFVEGMRNHMNAAKAMLLYMQMTWNDLISNSTVSNAMQEGIATQEQLMAAGYNSNPARLKIYIRRGGANWTNLIPRETKIYLQIYESVERFVPMKPRTR
jgi:hypothetical protein